MMMYHQGQQSKQQYNNKRQQQQTAISSSNVISSPSTPTSSIYSSSVRSSAFSNSSGSMSYSNSPFVEWEEEQRKQLTHAQTLLTQKEYENSKLREAISDWQTKARKWNEAQEKLKEQVRHVIAEKEALRKAYSKKCNDDAETIMTLSQEVKYFKNKKDQDNTDKEDAGDLCSTAEETYKKAASQMLYGRRKKTGQLIVGINDMVKAIEEELSQLQSYNNAVDGPEKDDDDNNNSQEADADNGEKINSGTNKSLKEDNPETETTLVPEKPNRRTADGNVQHHMNHTPVKPPLPPPAILQKQQEKICSADDDDDVTKTAKQIKKEKEEELSLTNNNNSKNDDDDEYQKRTFRPRSQTMDTIVKKASMFLRSSSNNSNHNNNNKKNSTSTGTGRRTNISKKPRPQSTVGLPGIDYFFTTGTTIDNVDSQQQQNPNTAMVSYNSSKDQDPRTGVATKRQQLFHRLSTQALSSYYQSTPLFKTSSVLSSSSSKSSTNSKSTHHQTEPTSGVTLRQAIIAAENAQQKKEQQKRQNETSSSTSLATTSSTANILTMTTPHSDTNINGNEVVYNNNNDKIISSQQQLNTATSTFMHYYRKQQQKLHTVGDSAPCLSTDNTSIAGTAPTITHKHPLDQQQRRKRRSAMISTCSSPLAGNSSLDHAITTTTNNNNDAKPIQSKKFEQWKISSSQR